MHKLAKFILQGPTQAFAVAGVLGGLAQMSFLFALPCAAIVALFALRKGEQQGFTALLGTAILATLIASLVESRPGFNYPVALLLLFPAYLGARILRASESQGLAAVVITACAIMFAIAVQLLSGDAEQWWNAWLKTALTGVPEADFANFDAAAPALNGVIALLLGILSTACLFGARWAQGVLFNPGGFGREFGNLAIPAWTLIALLPAVPVAALISPALLYDVLLVSAMPFFFQGLAVLQHTAAKKRTSGYMMSLPYLLLLLAPQILIVGYACLGAVDMFFNFRKLPRKKS